MAKNKFTSAQLKRLKTFQSRRVERASQTNNVVVDSDDLGPEQHGILITHHSVLVIVRSDDGRLIKCTLRQNLGALVVGDHVVWQAIDDNNGVVVACKPRRSVILRQSGHTTKPVVANVDVMIIVVGLAPLPQLSTIDRYLILAHTMKLKALIVVNKVDLFASREHQDLFDRAQVYESIGYPVIKISTTTKLGIDELSVALKDITSIVVGQSGVGKSSLLDTLVPNSKAQISSLSNENTMGRQTTSASTLYQLPTGGNLIDSPGIHQLKLKHLSPEQIIQGFIEFAPYLGSCQFRNCLHAHEPGCALRKAVIDDKIAAFRLENYHTILADPL